MEQVIRDSLRRSRLCSGLSNERLAELARVVSYERRDAGEVLFRAGDAADRFFILLHGHVVLTIDEDTRHGSIARIVHAGETFAEAAIGEAGTHEETAEALGPVVLAVVPGSALADLLVQRFDLVLQLLGTLSIQLRGLVRQISDMKMKSAARRLASHLLGFTDASEGAATIHLPYARKILAQDLGMQPETLSRAFLKLQRLGVQPLGDRDTYRIADVAALRAVCEDEALHDASE